MAIMPRWVWIGAVCAALVAAQSETYTLLHRVQTIGGDGKQVNTPWQPRALIRYPTTVAGEEGLVVNEGIPSEMSFPRNDENAFYQVKVVEGDARTFSADAWSSKVNGKGGILSMTKLVCEPLTQCQMRAPPGEPVEDTIEVHLSKPPLEIGDTSSPPYVVGLTYGILPRVPYNNHACPIYDGDAPHSDGFSTVVSVSVPVVPETYVYISPSPLRRKDKIDEETPEGEAKKKEKAPFDLVAFLRKYWYYILPIVILFMLPMPEDVQDTQPRATPGRVAPGPGKGPAQPGTATGRAGRR